jgi:hypothetical protein
MQKLPVIMAGKTTNGPAVNAKPFVKAVESSKSNRLCKTKHDLP